MGQGLSNEFKFVKIGRLEPEIWVDKEIASKWKIYISKLKPVKDIERLIKRGPLCHRTFSEPGRILKFHVRFFLQLHPHGSIGMEKSQYHTLVCALTHATIWKAREKLCTCPLRATSVEKKEKFMHNIPS
jgi:hypothetical protein